MNWTRISGNFIASGTEKYLLIGNYKSNSNTNSILSNSTNLPAHVADYLIDAVSVVKVNLAAYAGPDHLIVPGDSAYIGRDPDFAIDSGCTWFKLPNLTTAIDTISGLWVKPTVTTTYVVRQILDCSSEKWDRVVVHINPVGIFESEKLSKGWEVFPNPASDVIDIRINNAALKTEFKTVAIYNCLN